jgi:hypothetical protein
MKFKIGDKVNFLNDLGGGVVTKIIDETLVHVTIDDGFEIPVLAKELIKTGTVEIAENIALAHQQMLNQSQEKDYNDDLLSLYLSPNNTDEKVEGLYFCFVPQVQENPLSGPLDILLINHTQYHSIFSLFLNYNGDYHGSEYGFLEPESALLVTSIGRSEIEKWANGLWQSIFYKEDKCTPVPPFSGLINFRPIKLYKEESFQYETLLRKKAFMVQVSILSEITSRPLIEEKINKETLKTLEEKMGKTGTSISASQIKPQGSFLEKHKIDDKIAEVDLHIGELIDNFSNLGKKDLLNIQTDYFKKCLQQAEKEKLSKVIFIHGVGNGVLKTELNKILESTNGIEFYDAPYARYGMGATEVKFYRNQ